MSKDLCIEIKIYDGYNEYLVWRRAIEQVEEFFRDNTDSKGACNRQPGDTYRIDLIATRGYCPVAGRVTIKKEGESNGNNSGSA